MSRKEPNPPPPNEKKPKPSPAPPPKYPNSLAKVEEELAEQTNKMHQAFYEILDQECQYALIKYGDIYRKSYTPTEKILRKEELIHRTLGVISTITIEMNPIEDLKYKIIVKAKRNG